MSAPRVHCAPKSAETPRKGRCLKRNWYVKLKRILHGLFLRIFAYLQNINTPVVETIRVVSMVQSTVTLLLFAPHRPVTLWTTAVWSWWLGQGVKGPAAFTASLGKSGVDRMEGMEVMEEASLSRVSLIGYRNVYLHYDLPCRSQYTLKSKHNFSIFHCSVSVSLCELLFALSWQEWRPM